MTHSSVDYVTDELKEEYELGMVQAAVVAPRVFAVSQSYLGSCKREGAMYTIHGTRNEIARSKRRAGRNSGIESFNNVFYTAV